jgi:hypothetical protein
MCRSRYLRVFSLLVVARAPHGDKHRSAAPIYTEQCRMSSDVALLVSFPVAMTNRSYDARRLLHMMCQLALLHSFSWYHSFNEDVSPLCVDAYDAARTPSGFADLWRYQNCNRTIPNPRFHFDWIHILICGYLRLNSGALNCARLARDRQGNSLVLQRLPRRSHPGFLRPRRRHIPAATRWGCVKLQPSGSNTLFHALRSPLGALPGADRRFQFKKRCQLPICVRPSPIINCRSFLPGRDHHRLWRTARPAAVVQDANWARPFVGT